MLKLSDTKHVVRNYLARRGRSKLSSLWVCEWKMSGAAPSICGVFLIEAGHYVEAKHTAHKFFRDHLSPARVDSYRVREVAFFERCQVSLAQLLKRLFGDDESAVVALKNDFANRCSPLEKATPV